MIRPVHSSLYLILYLILYLSALPFPAVANCTDGSTGFPCWIPGQPLNVYVSLGTALFLF